jgi:hypothetical protein
MSGANHDETTGPVVDAVAPLSRPEPCSACGHPVRVHAVWTRRTDVWYPPFTPFSEPSAHPIPVTRCPRCEQEGGVCDPLGLGGPRCPLCSHLATHHDACLCLPTCRGTGEGRTCPVETHAPRWGDCSDCAYNPGPCMRGRGVAGTFGGEAADHRHLEDLLVEAWAMREVEERDEGVLADFAAFARQASAGRWRRSASVEQAANVLRALGRCYLELEKGMP